MIIKNNNVVLNRKLTSGQPDDTRNQFRPWTICIFSGSKVTKESVFIDRKGFSRNSTGSANKYPKEKESESSRV